MQKLTFGFIMDSFLHYFRFPLLIMEIYRLMSLWHFTKRPGWMVPPAIWIIETKLSIVKVSWSPGLRRDRRWVEVDDIEHKYVTKARSNSGRHDNKMCQTLYIAKKKSHAVHTLPHSVSCLTDGTWHLWPFSQVERRKTQSRPNKQIHCWFRLTY